MRSIAVPGIKTPAEGEMSESRHKSGTSREEQDPSPSDPWVFDPRAFKVIDPGAAEPRIVRSAGG